jgi:predicted permease
MLISTWKDIRFALRQLRRSPGFTAAAILTLALGIGATTAIFTLIDQVILSSLPVQHPNQLYKVGKSLDCCISGGLQDDWSLFSYDLFRSLQDQTPNTAGVLAVQAGTTILGARTPGDNAAAQPIPSRFVSGNYFQVLGVPAYAGRMMSPEDDKPGATPVAVISYALWQGKFAANPSLVGRPLILSGHAVIVIGISAPAFQGERNQGDAVGLWLPLSQEPIFQSDRQLLKFPDQHWLDILLRIPNPKDVPHVQLAIQTELKQWIAAHPGLDQHVAPTRLSSQTTELISASGGISDLRDQYEHSLKLLFLVAGFVLLIACANLANLMLVRGVSRRQELAVRSALGAPRVRLIRQMLVEALLLSIGGGIAALGVAYLGARAILSIAFQGTLLTPITPLDATPSPTILAFAFAISLATGILFGIAPAWIYSNSQPIDSIRGASRSTSDSSSLPQRLLIIFQASLSLVLLSTAGLLISSLRQLEHQDFHFNPEGRLILFIDLPSAGYQFDQLNPLYQRLDNTLSHIPAIESFGYATYSPMAFNNWVNAVFFPGKPSTGDHPSVAAFSLVSPHFFEAVGTRLLLGRPITDQDTPTSTPVAVVNQAFVNTYLDHQPPIGAHFGEEATRTNQFEIVGVVEDSKYGNPSQPTRPMYFPSIRQSTPYTNPKDLAFEHSEHFASNLVVQYRGDQASAAEAVRQALKTVDPNISIFSMSSYTDQLSSNFTLENMVVRLTTLFGLLAIVLASVGIYGVTAYAVARRTSEIGIRMALGATRVSVLGMILTRSLTQALVGLAIGIPLAYAAARMLQSSLYRTPAFQPIVLAVVSALLLFATVAAAAIPSVRAASTNPIEALRTE